MEERPTTESRWGLWAVLVCAGLALAVGLAYRLRPFLPPPKVLNFTQITRDGRPKGSPLLTDGARVYFHHPPLVPGPPLQVSALGGEPVPVVTTLSDDVAPMLSDISADCSEFLMEGSGRQWILPTVGGEPTRVGDVPGTDAAWAPDGRHIAYEDDRGLYISKRDGSEPRKFADLEGFPSWLQWSPDGRVLRFTLLLTGNPGFLRGALWEIRPDGTHLHPVLPDRRNQELECCGHWTADGRYYVFRSGQNRGDLWARCEKGTLFRRCSPEPEQLTAGPLSFLDVAPSRDGKKLFAIGSDRRVELVKYDLESREFQPYLSGISAEGISFSRDGQWVVYASTPEGRSGKAGSTGPTGSGLLLRGCTPIILAGHRTGAALLFKLRVPAGNQRVYVMPAGGGHPQQVGGDNEAAFWGEDSDVNWSPDGKSLIFARIGWELSVLTWRPIRRP
ncbi:MAG TPA: hypothetical protein VI455_12760 [Terriglobia bacterium]